ncbi:alpha/beta hydrolase [Compostibacter hankyongensis]|uniref:AB hydrolase-1 domain-containing protein n=1 Tax=Compostibacter hankyongensis TaxID=1007089 RepID=A0ABP8FXL1_9BACT
MDVYFISGLGADERIFQYLQPEGIRLRPVKWITPHATDTLHTYAKRLLSQIPDPHPVILGMSMGGMAAAEIAKLIPVRKIILVSSIKTCRERPWYFGLLRIIKVHRWLSYRLLTRMGLWLGDWLFGTGNAAESRLLHEVIRDTDETFFRWAWEQVIRWDNKTLFPGTVHIHGDRDCVLPLRYVHPDHVIRGGTHFMIVDRAEELSALIAELILPEIP